MSNLVQRSVDYKVRIYLNHHKNASEDELLQTIDAEVKSAINNIEGVKDAFTKRYSTYVYASNWE